MGGWHSSLYFENIEDNKAKINCSFLFFFFLIREASLSVYWSTLEIGRGYPEGRFLVCSHVCNIALDWVIYQQLEFDVGNSKAGKFRLKVGMVSDGDVLLSGLRMASWCCVLCWQGTRELAAASFIREWTLFSTCSLPKGSTMFSHIGY